MNPKISWRSGLALSVLLVFVALTACGYKTTTYSLAPTAVALLRFNANGTPDITNLVGGTGLVTIPVPPNVESSMPLESYCARAITNLKPIFECPARRMLVPLTATALAVVELPNGMGVVTIPVPAVPKPVSRAPGVPVLMSVW